MKQAVANLRTLINVAAGMLPTPESQEPAPPPTAQFRPGLPPRRRALSDNTPPTLPPRSHPPEKLSISQLGKVALPPEPARPRRASTGTSLFDSVRTSPVPDDGNCFMHSLIRLAGPQLQGHVELLPGGSLRPAHVRAHMTSHLIDQFNAQNAIQARGDEAANSALSDRAPWLMHLADQSLDFHDPEVQNAFLAAVGPDQLHKCMDLSDAQKTHVLHMAQDKTFQSKTSGLRISAFDHQVGDLMPAIAASAFPGLRLSVITRATTAENQGVHGIGREPIVRLRLDARHYEPVVGSDQPHR